MKIDLTKKSHKMILLLSLAIPILIMGWLWTAYQLHQTETSETIQKSQNEKLERKEPKLLELSPTVDEQTENVDTVPFFHSQEEIDTSKMVAEKFSQAYANYDSAQPYNFLHNAKPYMTEGFYNEWATNYPRRPLALVKSTAVKTEAYPIDGGDKYSIAWNVVINQAQINTLGDQVPVEEWFYVILNKENGEWKVKDVDITHE